MSLSTGVRRDGPPTDSRDSVTDDVSGQNSFNRPTGQPNSQQRLSYYCASELSHSI